MRVCVWVGGWVRGVVAVMVCVCGGGGWVGWWGGGGEPPYGPRGPAAHATPRAVTKKPRIQVAYVWAQQHLDCARPTARSR